MTSWPLSGSAGADDAMDLRSGPESGSRIALQKDKVGFRKVFDVSPDAGLRPSNQQSNVDAFTELASKLLMQVVFFSVLPRFDRALAP